MYNNQLYSGLASMDFFNATKQDLQLFGKQLFQENRGKWTTFEQTSNFIVNHVRNTLTDSQGQPIFALLRIFKLVTPQQVPPEGLKTVPQAEQYLALMGTTGLQPAWNDRHQSTGHRLIPAGAFTTPMLKAAFEQIGLQRTNPPNDSDEDNESSVNENGQFIQTAAYMSDFFHVEQALGSPYIVVQEDFVQRYNIQSVVGIGSLFATRSFYLMIGFSTVSINRENAEKFAVLSPYISTLLATYAQPENLWIVEPAS